MTDQPELQGLRRRLLGVLWERLAELEADATREAIWRKTNWDLAEGDPCSRCHKPSLRLIDAMCLPCIRDIAERADGKERLRQRYLRFVKAHNARVDKRKGRGAASAAPLRITQETAEG
jgi:cytochrome c551/c552